MSKKFKSQASSARAASSLTGFASFQTTSSPLSYVTELPDLTQIDDSNVVVAFKNLGKKDSTTKEKALEELQNNLSGTVSPAILSAWSELYPKTSIDNSRRVRVSAHALQGSLTVSAGKKIAPFLPKVIGSWLAGTFDNDKIVAKAAHNALEKAFATEEKRKALWNIYHDALLEYVRDATTVQSVSTLSDERTTSPDDAQAKYVRVVGTGLYVLGQLLNNGTTTEILQDKKLWDFAYHQDSYLRNATYTLVMITLEKQANELDWKVLSKCFLYEGLRKEQLGSCRLFSEALLKLTQLRPQLWTSDYSAKTPVLKRLLQFLRQGSQNGPEIIWTNLDYLMRSIPAEVLYGQDEQSPESFKSISSVIEALRVGVASERVYSNAAWTTYIWVCLWVVGKFKTEEEKKSFIEQSLSPLLMQYVTRGSDKQWTVGGNAAQTLSGLILGLLEQKQSSALQEMWRLLVNETIEKMKLSLPATSKEFRTSQDAVITQVRRLYDLKPKAGSSFLQECTHLSDLELLKSACDLLQSRNGNPYSAAAALEVLADQGFKADPNMQNFLEVATSTLLDSPSCERLVSLCLKCGKPIAKQLLEQKSTSNTDGGLLYLLKNGPASMFEDLSVQPLISSRLGDLNEPKARSLATAILYNTALSGQPIEDDIWQKVMNNLMLPSNQESALALLESLTVGRDIVSVPSFKTYRAEVISKLLVIGDSSSPFAQEASSLASKISTLDGHVNTLPIVQQQLDGQRPLLSILTLEELGKELLGKATLTDLLPNAEQWIKALSPHLSTATDVSLTITSPLQGVIWCLESTSKHDEEVIRDSEDFSLLFRLAFYVTKLINDQELTSLDSPTLEALYRFYPLALQLINEKVTLEDANDIWIGSTAEVLQEALEIVSGGAKLIREWLQDDRFWQIWLSEGHSLQGTSRESFWKASAFVNIASQHIDEHGSSEMVQDFEDQIQRLHRSDNILQSGALLSVMHENLATTSQGMRICNELVASVTEPGVKTQMLVLLNLLVNGNSEVMRHIPQQRIVFLMKNLVRILEERMSAAITTEAFKSLTVILPLVQEIYGEHWQQILQTVIEIWNAGSYDLPLLHATLRTYARMKSLLKTDEINEDLEEAWTSSKADLDSGLLSCLQSFVQPSLGTNQPRSITAELLRRQLIGVQPNKVDNLFGLLESSEKAVQDASYELLHHIIPERQEELSLELALEKRPAHLPNELLELVLDTTQPRQYLLTWGLIFDHFPKASHMLQEIYTEDIKGSGHLNQLLTFLCGRLRITENRPVDASKFGFVDYQVGEADSDEKDVQWLSIHVYYVCLLYVPGLAKDWFIQQPNRVKLPLEKWTKQHVSPLIVAASLKTVIDWAATQSQDEADRPVNIRASPKGSELVASIKIDPESPSISLVVTLPGSYPLESPVVTSRERVGVSDKNWTSWMRTFQIIIFSSGSIIEGLTAFRRNVQLALEGQSECAICYSIIGTDMKTPDKKCGTCKNMFHAICLYRWFKSSNSSSCPLCRNNFNYA